MGCGAPNPCYRAARWPDPDPSLPAFDVAMHEHGRQATRADPRGELLGEDDRAMVPARAADGDREVALPLGDVAGERDLEERLEPLEVGAVELRTTNVVSDLGIGARVWPELRHPVGVRQEPHVEEQVG